MTNEDSLDSVYIKTNNSVTIANIKKGDIFHNLPVGVYKIKPAETVLELTRLDASYIQLPTKMYGNLIDNRTKLIIQRFKRANKNVGILLSGDKGSGKTLLMNNVCKKMLDNGYPIIFCDIDNVEIIKNIISSVKQCVMVFDEFGKIVNHKNQDKLLSILDGMNNNKEYKKLFLFTENYVNRINEFMLNRPSRILYHFRFAKLPENTVKEYLDIYNVKKPFKKDVLDMLAGCKRFSFDDLQTLTDEHINNPDIPLSDMLSYINCNIPENDMLKNGVSLSRLQIPTKPDTIIDSMVVDGKKYSLGDDVSELISRTTLEVGSYPLTSSLCVFLSGTTPIHECRLYSYKIIKIVKDNAQYLLASNVSEISIVLENTKVDKFKQFYETV